MPARRLGWHLSHVSILFCNLPSKATMPASSEGLTQGGQLPGVGELELPPTLGFRLSTPSWDPLAGFLTSLDLRFLICYMGC